MRGEDDRGLLLPVDIGQDIEDDLLIFTVDIRRRFIAEQDLRPDRQGTGQGHPFGLPP